MILRQGVTASYIVLEGWERHSERDAIRDWCLANDMVIDATEHLSSDKADVNAPPVTIIVRFANKDDAMLCYLTLSNHGAK